jgi:hypothetical protein
MRTDGAEIIEVAFLTEWGEIPYDHKMILIHEWFF